MKAGKVVALVAGCFVALIGAALLIGAGALTWAYTTQRDDDLVQKPTTNPAPPNWKQGGYLEHLPKDPWGSDYQFLSPGVKGEIDVFSLGADRARGGEGNAADVGNWD